MSKPTSDSVHGDQHAAERDAAYDKGVSDGKAGKSPDSGLKDSHPVYDSGRQGVESRAYNQGYKDGGKKS